MSHATFQRGDTMPDIRGIIHSPEFVARWMALLRECFGCEKRGPYCVIRDVLWREVYSFLPLLNYTDKTSATLQADLAQLHGVRYYARAINPTVAHFEKNDPVTMRLPLRSAHGPEDLWGGRFDAKLRNQIRKSEKSGLRVVMSRDLAQIEDFYRLYRRRMHDHGSPCLGREVFVALTRHVDASYYVAYKDDRPAAGLVLVWDGPLAWVPWAASDRALRAYCPNHITYWQAIQDAQRQGCALFDFGRSPYLGETYHFKRQWGALPVKVDILQPQAEDVYGRYAFATTLWRRLPAIVVDRIGPVLCRHLPEL